MKLSEQVFPASVFDGTQICRWMMWQVRLNHGLRSMRQFVKQREQNEESSDSEIRIKIPHIQIVSAAEVIKVLTYSRHINRSVLTLTYLT